MSSRIACIYLPSFPLQVHVRHAPHLSGGGPFAVASASTPGGPRPVVIACSRAAYDAGIRRGTAVTQARVICPELRVVIGSQASYRDAAGALAETLFNLSPVVSIGESDLHQCIYVELPRGVRGASFGQSLQHHIASQGYSARIGVADDRFTARIAAQTGHAEAAAQLTIDSRAQPFTSTCTTIPRGGSAAFLAPLPLQLLPLTPEVLHLLKSFGISTLGEFAALPPPSNHKRWDQNELDLRAMARGDDHTPCPKWQPTQNVAELLECAGSAPSDYSFPLRTLADRSAERLRGRGVAAQRVKIEFAGQQGGQSTTREVEVELSPPTLSGRTLFVAIMNANLPEMESVQRVSLRVEKESAPDSSELDLFRQAGPPDAQSVDNAIARTQQVLRQRRPQRRRSATQPGHRDRSLRPGS